MVVLGENARPVGIPDSMAIVRKYESDRFTLYQADAAEVVETLAPKSVDLLATDPPYHVKYVSGFRNKKFAPIIGDDGTVDAIGLCACFVRHALTPFRHVYVFGADKTKIQDPMQLSGVCDLIWDKGQPGMGDLTSPWGPQHEPIAFGMYVPSAANRASGRGNLAARMRQGSVLRVNRLNSRRVSRHPTEKPVALMRIIVESSSLADDIVLDPFLGSGSTAVAAILCGRRAVGVEIDPDYYEIALARCKAAEAAWYAMNEI